MLRPLVESIAKPAFSFKFCKFNFAPRLSDDYDRTPGNKKGKSFFEMKGAQKAASFMVRWVRIN